MAMTSRVKRVSIASSIFKSVHRRGRSGEHAKTGFGCLFIQEGVALHPFALLSRILAMAFTYTDLVDNDHNMLIQSQRPGQQAEFINSWRPKGACLEQLVAHHLSLSPHRCRVASHEDWLSGSFNLCIPVDIERHPRVLVRLPFPHRFRSHTSPGMASEKIRNEAGTFAWLSKHCPNVPIPRLWAFGLSDGRSFRSLAQVSWARWLYEWLRRKLQQGLFDNNRWNPFAPSYCPIRLSTGYLIMNYIEPQQGSMLSTKWPSANQHHRRTLFRSLANILLDLIQVPLPRIGSFRALDNGEVTLSGHPLTAALASLEAQNTPSYPFNHSEPTRAAAL